MAPRMRSVLKRSAERLLASAPVLSLAGVIRPISAAVLAYHNVVESIEPPRGDRSLHVPLDQFIEQVNWLSGNFSLIALDDLLDERSAADPVAVITFDDAYEGAVRLALPELAARGLPATVFACSALRGGESMWWDALARPAGLPTEVRVAALEECGGREKAVKEWARRRRLESVDLPPDYRISSHAALETATTGTSIAVGSHTHTHPDLSCLTDSELRDELTTSLEFLRNRFSAFVPWLAYPYGLADRRVGEAARDAGFIGALRVRGGPVRTGELDPYHLPRVYVPRDCTLENLRLRMAGIL